MISMCEASDLLQAVGMTQHVTQPTHRDGHILDFVISCQCDALLQDVEVLPRCMSDHHAVPCQLQMARPVLAARSMPCRKMRNIDPVNGQVRMGPRGTACGLWRRFWVAAAAQHYHDSIISVLEKYAPVKLCTIRSNTAKSRYSDVIHGAHQLRWQCECKWLKTRLEIHRELYVRQQEQVVRLINSAKQDYFRATIASAMQSNAYRVINNLLTSTTTQSLPSHDSEQELADHFVQFFHCKVTAIRTALDDMQQQLPPLLEEPLPTAVPTLDGFSTVTSADLLKLVQGSASMSCMLDPAPTRLLKKSAVAVLDCVLPHMLHIVNESLGSSVVSACLKMAVITPILKKPSLCVNSLKNFRPVPNLPFLGKVIEKVVASQLSSHLSAHEHPWPHSVTLQTWAQHGDGAAEDPRWHQQRPGCWGRQSALFSWISQRPLTP